MVIVGGAEVPPGGEEPACVTVSVKPIELTVFIVAVMLVDPAAVPVASPLFAMVATPVLDELQLTWPVTSLFDLSL